MIIACCLFKYFPYGGLQRDFLQIAKALVARGIIVRTYVLAWQGKTEFYPEFNIIIVPTESCTNHGRCKEYYYWVKDHIESHPVDIILGFNKMPHLDFYYAADICYEERISKEKNFFSLAFYRLTPRFRLFKSFEESIFKKGHTTKIIALTNKTIYEYQKYYNTEPQRFILLPPGIEINKSSLHHFNRKDFRRNLKISDKQIVLLQVCSNYKLKGVDRTLLAISSLSPEIRKDILLIIAGQDESSRFIKLANSLNISQNVRFIGPRNDIPLLMRSCDIFIHPAHFDCAGKVIIEAIFSELPVITTSTCGYSDYVIQADCGYVIRDPFSQIELNHILHQFILNKPLLLRFAANAKLFSQSHNFSSFTNQFIDSILFNHKR